jgi:hypothetical protein
MAVDIQIQKMEHELALLGCPVSTIAAISAVSNGTLSHYRSGAQQPSRQDTLKISEALTDLKNLVAAAAPLPLDFRRVGELKDLIAGLKGKSLTIFVRKSGEPVERGFVVLFAGGYFSGLENGRPAKSLNEGAAFNVPTMTSLIADMVVERVMAFGYQGVVKREAVRDSEPIDDFDKVWR